jgi:hypothetical protein
MAEHQAQCLKLALLLEGLNLVLGNGGKLIHTTHMDDREQTSLQDLGRLQYRKLAKKLGHFNFIFVTNSLPIPIASSIKGAQGARRRDCHPLWVVAVVGSL